MERFVFDLARKDKRGFDKFKFKYKISLIVVKMVREKIFK